MNNLRIFKYCLINPGGGNSSAGFPGEKILKIGGLQKTSLLDYPEKISAIIFTQGCNFRCGYCHNPELVGLNRQDELIPESFIWEFLNKRRGILDGVVITGGEPCLQPDLADFIRKVKSMNFLVKLDTNGAFPDVVENLISENLVDYIAMDIKAPLEKYSCITNSYVDTTKIQKSINIILNSNIAYEFRTTVLKSLLSSEDIENIGKIIHSANRYYLQKFVETKILNPEIIPLPGKDQNYTEDELLKLLDMLRLNINIVDIR